MPPTGFEPAFPATERPQTHVLDRAATGIDQNSSQVYGTDETSSRAATHQQNTQLQHRGVPPVPSLQVTNRLSVQFQ